VGGFDLALERAGVEVKAMVEWDKNAQGVLRHRFPNVALFGDVQEVTGDDLRGAGFVPERGIITGGFPCQDLSVAGKRAGLAGERSGLFWEIIRLIDDLRPKWVILENVPGLLSSNGGRDMGTVIGTLAECGYGVAYRVLDAQYFGVPQRRRRVFIVGCLGDNGRAPAEILALTEGLRGDSTSNDTPRKKAPREVGAGASSGNQFYGQTGFAQYTVGQVKTLSATDYKRPEDNLVVGPAIAFGHTQGLSVQASEVATPTLRKNGNGAAAVTGTAV
jgi:DNA (cytosine-5)-methyltransferase 1